MGCTAAARRTVAGAASTPEEPHLAPVDQARHGAHRVLDGDGGIDAMLEVEVDRLHAQALEAGVARLGHVLGAAVDALLAVRGAHVAELRREHDLVTPPLEDGREELLALAPAVQVGGVEEFDAPVEGVVEGGDGLPSSALP